MQIISSGMKQTEVAMQIGASQATVSDILNGKIKDPRVSIADRIRALHVERCAELSEGE